MPEFHFQPLSWDVRHEGGTEDWDGKIVIRAYGRMQNGKSICVIVGNFCPDFYVAVPADVLHDKAKANSFAGAIKRHLEGSEDGENWKRRKYTKPIRGISLDEARIVAHEFTFRTKVPMMRIFMHNMNALRDARTLIRDRGIKWGGSKVPRKYDCYDSGIEPLLRMFHIYDLNPTKWLTVEGKVVGEEPKGEDEGHLVVETKCEDMRIMENAPAGIARFVRCSFDIETVPKDEKKFPSPYRPGDEVIQVGLSFRRYGEKESYAKYVICLGESADLAGVELVCVESEKELLLEFSRIVREENPDVITGYNILGFDWEYLYVRAVHWGIEDEFLNMGKVSGAGGMRLPSVRKIKDLQSSGLGINHFDYIDIPGRENIDVMFQVKKRPEKLRSYRLDAVAEHYIGQNKVDLPYKVLFAKYREGGAENIRTIAHYCIGDVELCHDLNDAKSLQLLDEDFGMSMVSLVPVNYLQLRGQGIKVESCLYNKLYKNGFSIKDVSQEDKGKKVPYAGGLVIQPKETGLVKSTMPKEEDDPEFAGLGMEEKEAIREKLRNYTAPVSVLDFMSLYPTQIMAHNVSPDTRVANERICLENGVKWQEYNVMDDSGRIVRKSRFVIYDPKIPETKGMFYEIIDDLFKSRKYYKKEMTKAKEKAEEDLDKKEEWEALAGLYNNWQKAYKVVMNSVYGITGASMSPLYSVDVAATITHLGREKLGLAASYMRDNYPECPVIYGDTDSIFVKVNFRVLLKEWKELLTIDVPELKRRWEALGSKWAGEITKHIGRPPTTMEYEKTFWRFISVKKKHYAALKFEPGINHPERNISGLAPTRREYAPIIRKIFDDVNDIFYDTNGEMKDAIKKIGDKLEEDLKDVLLGNIPTGMLEMTSSVKDGYAYAGNKQALFMNRMMERDPGTAPQAGDRVQFYYVKVNDEEIEKRREKDGLDTRPPPKRKNYKRKPKILEGDRLEPLSWITENDMELDTEYYVENHIKTPIKQFVSYIDESLGTRYDEVLAKFRAGRYDGEKKVTIDKFWKTMDYFDSGELMDEEEGTPGEDEGEGDEI